MLLAIDIGNTNTVLGIFDGEILLKKYRVNTNLLDTTDEIAVKISSLISLGNIRAGDITDIILCSVVPSVTGHYLELSETYFARQPLVVGPGLKTGMQILYENPKEVGADRVANAIGGIKLYGPPLIIVDLGTAITFDAISEKGEYLGGVIAPGIETSIATLSKRAAQLPQISISVPKKVIGRNTIHSMQSGAVFGFAGLIDELVSKMKNEMGCNPKVVATGGHCEWFKGICQTIEVINPDLTLFGLYHIYIVNQ